MAMEGSPRAAPVPCSPVCPWRLTWSAWAPSYWGVWRERRDVMAAQTWERTTGPARSVCTAAPGGPLRRVVEPFPPRGAVPPGAHQPLNLVVADVYPGTYPRTP